MKCIQVKRLSLFLFVFLFLSVPSQRLFAGGKFKEKLQQKLNSSRNINFKDYESVGQAYRRASDSSATSRNQGGINNNERIASSLEQTGLSRRLTNTPALSTYAIYQTDYKAELEENVITVKGKVIFQVFQKGRTRIPLVKSNVGLIDVSVNRGPAFVTMLGGRYYLMMDKPGKYTLHIEFLIKAARERENGPGSFAIGVPPAPISQFEFTMPESGVEIFIEPAIKVESKEEQNKTIAWAVMPSTNSISVRWTKALPKEKIAPVKLESKVYVDTATYASVGEGIIRCQTRLNYSILQSEVSNFRIAMPEDVSLLDVKGRDLRDWKVSQGEGIQYLDVYVNFGIKGSYVLNLIYEHNIGEGSVVAQVPWVKAMGVERENGYFGIAASTNVELAVNKIEHVNLIDVKELPSSIWSRSANPILLAFKYLKHPFEITIDVTRHEELPVLIAVVDASDFVTLYTEEGKILTKATYQVRNNVKQFLRLVLPQDATLWSAFVAGKPVKPAKDKNGSILIPLEKSQLRGAALARFPVEIVYLDKGAKLRWLGQLKMNLPRIDIPISESIWTVYFPMDYTYFHFGGNVKRLKGRYRQRLGGFAGSYKTSHIMREESKLGVQREKRMDFIKSQFAPSQASVSEKGKAWQRKGALPIKVIIPRQGKRLRFSKLLVTKKEYPYLTARYTGILKKARWIIWPLLILVLIGVAISGFTKKRIRKQESKGKHEV